MTTKAESIDAATDTRVRRNLEMVRRFTLQIFEDPSLLDEVPDGQEIVFIPDDDPRLAEMNLQGGMRKVRAGHNIYFRHMPCSDPDASER